MDQFLEFNDEEPVRNRNKEFLMSQNSRNGTMTQRSEQNTPRERVATEDIVSKTNKYKAEIAKQKKENEQLKEEIRELKKQKTEFLEVKETLKRVVEKLDDLEKKVTLPNTTKPKIDDRHLITGDLFSEIFPSLVQIQGKNRFRRPSDENRVYYKKEQTLYDTSRFLCKNFPTCQQPTARGTLCLKCRLTVATNQGIPNTLGNIINNNT